MNKSNYRYENGISYDMKYFLHEYDAYKAKSRRRFYYITKDFTTFDSLNENRINELKQEAEKLRKKLCNENDKFCPLYYKVINQISHDNQFEKKYTVEEIIALLIETIDPSLKLLKISRKFNTNLEIETMSTKNLGFYDVKIVEFEREYARKFKKSNSKMLMKKLEDKNS